MEDVFGWSKPHYRGTIKVSLTAGVGDGAQMGSKFSIRTEPDE